MSRILSWVTRLLTLFGLLVVFLPQPVVTTIARQGSKVSSELVSLLPTLSQMPTGMTQFSEGQHSLQQLTATFANSIEAQSFYRAWGWEENAYRIFIANAVSPEVDPRQNDNATFVEITLNRFATAKGAVLARDYTAMMRATATGLYFSPPTIPDNGERVMLGPTREEYEVTAYFVDDTILARVTAINTYAPPGAVAGSVVQIVREDLLRKSTGVDTSYPVAGFLPNVLPLDHSACFRIEDEGTLNFQQLVERFPGVPNADSTLQALGWEEGAYRQFACDAPPPGNVGWIDISIHQFRDAGAAAAAVPFFASSRALGTDLQSATHLILGEASAALIGPASNGTEYTLYGSSGPYVFRVTGVAPTGNPQPDVESVSETIHAALIAAQRQALPTPVPLPTFSFPSRTPEPTETPIPTATLRPTATLFPTATLTPVATPTSVPRPTATPRPTQTRALPTSTPRSQPTVTTATVACTVVELYPGYPGYRGYAAGIDGPGEVACLEDLNADDPGFDRDAEDAANIAAARAIGLNGSPVDWTWENWMSIEAVRGLPATCYSCLIFGDKPDRQTADYDAADPRLWFGSYETTDVLRTWAPAMSESLFTFDHRLRGFVGLLWPGWHTAAEVAAEYDQLFAQYAEPGMTFFDQEMLWDSLLEQGGYVPTPPTASLDDQFYTVYVGAEAICATIMPDACVVALQRAAQNEQQYLNELYTGKTDLAYADWLRMNRPPPFSQ